MKSILLHVHDDNAQENRLSVALDLARAHGSQLTCLQVTPMSSFVVGDPMGGYFPYVNLLEASQKSEQEHRSRLNLRLKDEHVTCTWESATGDAAGALVDQGRLCDVLVLSRADNSAGEVAAPLDIIADVAVHARAPVFVVPPAQNSFRSDGTVMVAWNGSIEVAHSLRLTLAVLRKATQIVFVTVNDGALGTTAAAGQRYLAAHEIATDHKEWSCNGNGVAPTLLKAASELGASCIVMGAYGSSRFRELILGGVTRDLLATTTVPLLLSH